MKYSRAILDKEEYTQVATNYYTKQSKWRNATPVEQNIQQHVELCECVSARRESIIFTGQSACAIRNCSRLSKYEMRPHAICTNKKSVDIVRWHFGPMESDVEIINGLRIVSPLRMIWDLLRYDTPESILVCINSCLHRKLFTMEQLNEEVDKRNGMKGHRILARLAIFANDKCESALETLGWISLYNSGFEIPIQQHKITVGFDFAARVDMYWEYKNRKVILELDGLSKYDDKQILQNEKKREYKLRDLGYEVVRVLWADVAGGKLPQILSDNNIPKRRSFGHRFPK